ncbi:MAG: methylenetetrahydrofolate reductase [NAD(P)H] [Candidatus Omnitrophica bacterium]|nr:methylenetetrahydrofolate reductase [NAD(P)H] [Candidatus Omnitrophota bacterium]
MKIKELFTKEKKVFSFEFFPPKTEKGEKNLFRAIRELQDLQPDFVSVTYGALGTTQDKSLEIVKHIQTDMGLNVMAHYTCIGATEEKVDAFLKSLETLRVENILALRGDSPQGMSVEEAFQNSPFRHAIDLVRYIKKKAPHFSIGVAGYPEGHIECTSKEKSLRHLKEKVDAGADCVVTQLFFNNEDFFSFRMHAEKIGICVPIIPGIMPIENFRQLEKITALCGSRIPRELRDYFNRTDISDDDKKKFGIEHTTAQCRELLSKDIPGLHFYTLNKSSATREIFEKLHG